jgi:hypothetical protein
LFAFKKIRNRWAGPEPLGRFRAYHEEAALPSRGSATTRRPQGPRSACFVAAACSQPSVFLENRFSPLPALSPGESPSSAELLVHTTHRFGPFSPRPRRPVTVATGRPGRPGARLRRRPPAEPTPALDRWVTGSLRPDCEARPSVFRAALFLRRASRPSAGRSAPLAVKV